MKLCHTKSDDNSTIGIIRKGNLTRLGDFMEKLHLTDEIYGDIIRIFADDQIALDDHMCTYIEKKDLLLQNTFQKNMVNL